MQGHMVKWGISDAVHILAETEKGLAERFYEGREIHMRVTRAFILLDSFYENCICMINT